MTEPNDRPTTDDAVDRALDYAARMDRLLDGGGLAQDGVKRELVQMYAYAAGAWSNIAGVLSMSDMSGHMDEDRALALRQHEERAAFFARLDDVSRPGTN